MVVVLLLLLVVVPLLLLVVVITLPSPKAPPITQSTPALPTAAPINRTTPIAPPPHHSILHHKQHPPYGTHSSKQHTQHMQQQRIATMLECKSKRRGAVGSGAKRRGGYRSRSGETPIEFAVESYPRLAPGGVLVEGGSCEGGTHLYSQAGPI